ncbi:MAG: hypothetical protein JNM07_10250 [Phycisphaerae bacterium]|nr:hypothetical protein [Phycisphaerae bacterium]
MCGLWVGFGVCAREPLFAAPQQVPPPESGAPIVSVRYINGQVEMRDAADQTPILMPRGVGLHNQDPGPTPLSPAIRVEAQPTGFDVVYTFRNASGAPMPLGRLIVGSFTLGEQLTQWDFHELSRPEPIDFANGRKLKYPGYVYAPVVVFSNARYAVGVSVHYPVLEYAHQFLLGLSSYTGGTAEGEGGRGYFLEAKMQNFGPEAGESRLEWPAQMAPGESRTYVVSVRVTRNPQEWIRTLAPYRNYFRSVYGGVHYDRDPRPVHCLGLADSSFSSSDNPDGWVPGNRPDRYGWTNWIQYVQAQPNWQSFMIWGPSGLYRYRTDRNNPFLFASRWLANPNTAKAIDPNVGLNLLPMSGRQFGLWWGHSVLVHNQWEPDVQAELDPDNPDHVAAAFREMDTAIRSGTTMIGLDAFHVQYVPLWKLYPWLRTLQARYPNVKFITEPLSCDVMHSIAPTFVRGWWYDFSPPPTSVDELYLIQHPQHLADFLLPGHETWGGFTFHPHKKFFNLEYDDNQATSEIERLAALGYRPAFFPDRLFSLRTPAVASESWKSTVPPDLRIRVNTNYEYGRAVRADGRSTLLGEAYEPDAGGAGGGGGDGRTAGWVPQRPTRPGAPADGLPAAPRAPARAPVAGAPATPGAVPATKGETPTPRSFRLRLAPRVDPGASRPGSATDRAGAPAPDASSGTRVSNRADNRAPGTRLNNAGGSDRGLPSAAQVREALARARGGAGRPKLAPPARPATEPAPEESTADENGSEAPRPSAPLPAQPKR